MSGEYIMGANAVVAALRAGRRRIFELYILPQAKSTVLREAENSASEKGVPVIAKSREELTEICNSSNHQGIVARAEPFPYIGLKELLDSSAKKPRSPLLILEGIEDPQNLGAILRSSLAFGSGGVILRRRRAASLSPTALKTAAGAAEYLSICQVANINQTIDRVKKAGFWVVGLSANTSESILDFKSAYPIALVLGSEGKGLPPLVERNCDSLLKIPICEPTESLNVSVAAAVALWELFGRKQIPKELSTPKS